MKISACILAHNEEKNISHTISTLATSLPKEVPIKVYANGCTDQTTSICSQLQRTFPQLQVRVLEIASKINAWNVAFRENSDADFLIFTDGDVEVATASCQRLLEDLQENPTRIISTARQLPYGMQGEQWLVGFLQLPLKQEYLGGALYAVSREKLQRKLETRGLEGIPQEVACEDGFLEFILEPEELVISRAVVYYRPGNIQDYIRYLARIRWQNEQLKFLLGAKTFSETQSHAPFFKKFYRKWTSSQGERGYFFMALFAVLGRVFFKLLFRKKIRKAYEVLGPIHQEGWKVLTEQTRSRSTK